MSGSDAIQSVQFVTVKGKRLAILSAEDWGALVEHFHSIEDIEVARDALAKLTAAGGDRGAAGWLKWEDASDSSVGGSSTSFPKGTESYTFLPCDDGHPTTMARCRTCSSNWSENLISSGDLLLLPLSLSQARPFPPRGSGRQRRMPTAHHRRAMVIL